ncbi:PREDICTED: transcription elongation factor A protein 3 isoform X2 [Gekko japonicus]|uniref:Transcription elongation factor n=1 Tax=Gekko japonicus TaxID=146911 RepID=A0ABM1JW94_GEKJA|nr:PREDICTED: transcription elongation factor A protein 3 isoform X2 [Gekko japonicus]
MGQVEELLRMGRKLEKMVSRKNMEGALDLLKKLNNCTMTIQLLQTSRIGVAVNTVRKHCSNEEVVALAKILIKNWKKLLESSGTQKSKKEKEKGKKLNISGWKSEDDISVKLSKGSEINEKDRRPSTCSNPAASPTGSWKNSTNGKEDSKPMPNGPKAPTSPISPTFASSATIFPPYYLTGDSVRDKCIEMVSGALKMDDDYKEFGVNCDKMAAEIEDHIYQELKGTDMKYRNRVRSRISNLKDPKNPSLRRNVLSGAIPPSLIAKMTAEEMASDELKELRSAMTQEAIREHQMAKTGGTTTDLFQCGKCKKKNCTYNQVQTRSADEPMTTFVLCNECGNRWKFC